MDLPKTAQGPATLADNDAINKDKLGFTHPNLHRRIESDRPIHSYLDAESGLEISEIKPRDYQIGVYGTDSYRTTTKYVHDEESTEVEIP